MCVFMCKEKRRREQNKNHNRSSGSGSSSSTRSTNNFSKDRKEWNINRSRNVYIIKQFFLLYRFLLYSKTSSHPMFLRTTKCRIKSKSLVEIKFLIKLLFPIAILVRVFIHFTCDAFCARNTGCEGGHKHHSG